MDVNRISGNGVNRISGNDVNRNEEQMLAFYYQMMTNAKCFRRIRGV